MRSTILAGALGGWLLTSSAFAASLRPQGRGDCQFDSSQSPHCWGKYSIDDDYYENIPDTGVTREYWFDLQNSTQAFDGFERPVQTINGSFPGPTIFADWGDWIKVHVTNHDQHNGTSIHWHGVRQLNTTQFDGTNSIQQCPIAPGTTFTHTFRAAQYGHTWYHSHFAAQAWNGVQGGIVIRGPSTAPYDVDLGVMFLNDWFHNTTDYLWATSDRTAGAPSEAQNGLINGTNVYGSGGKRWETVFEPGTRYRIRLVNGAIDDHYHFSIDGHSMTVMANDFVPIKPYETNVLAIGIGERYDIVVEANQPAGDFWLRAIPATDCSGMNESQDNIKGIVRYSAQSTADPTTSEYPNIPTDCNDEPMASLVPWVSIDASAPESQDALDIDLPANVTSTGLRRWSINDEFFEAYWDRPTLQQGLMDPSWYTSTPGIAVLDEANVWAYIVLQNSPTVALAHPIHLHGHDFFVLAQEEDATYTSSSPLQLKDAPRRDTAMLPKSGYLVMGFPTDNPGIWPLHCHIGWHADQGFAYQLVERPSEIGGITDLDMVNDVCDAWKSYAAADGVVQDDSGI